MLFRRKKPALAGALLIAAKSKAARAALSAVGSILLIRAIRNRKYRTRRFFGKLAGR
jgi:hypothetical protein